MKRTTLPHAAATPEQVAVYAPGFPGLYGEVCRACTGRGHTTFRVHGRPFLTECGPCEGTGVVGAPAHARTSAPADVFGVPR